MPGEREVRIHGQVYRVRGDDADRIDRVAAYVDEMMNKVLGAPGKGLSTREVVLVALNMADLWFEKDAQIDKALSDLDQRTAELLSLLPE